MKKTLILKILFLTLLAFNSVYARWAEPLDAIHRDTFSIDIDVKGDGTYEKIIETTREILTEISRSEAANLTLHYSGDNEKLEILEAKTIDGSMVEHKLNKDLIEDKPLASSHHGFDQSRQVLLAFPNAEVGSTIYLKYKLTLKRPNLENFFGETFYFGKGKMVTGAKVKLKSKLPLHILINDPEKVLNVTENKDEDFYNLELDLTKPIYKAAVSEPANSIINHKDFVWVSVSSLDKWEDFALKHSKSYDQILSQKLPGKFEKILDKAKKKKSDIDKINTVTSLLNEKVRYLGDWRSVEGRYVPRDLATVAETHLGDCKDFSAATVAILNKLGFKAQSVLVMRGVGDFSPDTLPDFVAFNHAMVKATSKDGVVYWVDPTNFESMAGGIFPDIAGKMALVLDIEKPSYEMIPDVKFTTAGIVIKRTLDVLENEKIIESGMVTLKNEEALGIVGSALKVSENIIRDSLFRWLSDGTMLEEKNKKGLDLPKLDSRIVSNISFGYSFVRENEILKTNVGLAIKVPYGSMFSNIYGISQDYVSDILAGSHPYTSKSQTIIKNVSAKNVGFFNKEITTPWLYVKRECGFNKDGDLQIDDTFILYKNLISNKDIKSKDFIKLKGWLKDNFSDVIIVVEQKGVVKKG